MSDFKFDTKNSKLTFWNSNKHSSLQTKVSAIVKDYRFILKGSLGLRGELVGPGNRRAKCSGKNSFRDTKS